MEKTRWCDARWQSALGGARIRPSASRRGGAGQEGRVWLCATFRPMREAIRSVARPVANFGLMLLAAAAVGLGPVLGCDRNLDAFDPNEEPRQPDLARIFPENQGAFGEVPTLPPGESRTGPGGAAPAGAPEPSGSLSAASSPIRGRVEIAPELVKHAGSGSVLFLIARSAAAGGGPPLAVRRFVSPRFPLEFEIGQENVMIPSMRFEGAIQLTARLDSDGNAMTRLPGDLQGAMSTPLSPGAVGALLTLDQRL